MESNRRAGGDSSLSPDDRALLERDAPGLVSHAERAPKAYAAGMAAFASGALEDDNPHPGDYRPGRGYLPSHGAWRAGWLVACRRHGYDCITVGLGGFQGFRRQTPNATTSGYGDPEQLAEDLADGGWLVDKRDLMDSDRGVTLALRMPMLGIGLREPKRMGADVDRSLVANVSGWAPMAQACKPGCPESGGYGGLDSVPLSIYLDLWRKAGARIARKVNGALVWECAA